MSKINLLAFITNLGKYNEGELVGEWVEFPTTKEKLKQVFDEIGISNKPDKYGRYYEEYFTTDYMIECDDKYTNIHNISERVNCDLGEYTPIEKLQVVGEMLNRINDVELVNALCSIMDLADALLLDAENGAFIIPADSEADLGYYLVDEFFGGVENMSREDIERYFDYDMYGRDARIEYYNDDNPEETIEEMLGLSEYATDCEIGEELVAQLGFENIPEPERYFDYKGYGRDALMDDYINKCDGRYVYITDNVNGEEYYNDIQEDLFDAPKESDCGEER